MEKYRTKKNENEYKKDFILTKNRRCVLICYLGHLSLFQVSSSHRTIMETTTTSISCLFPIFLSFHKNERKFNIAKSNKIRTSSSNSLTYSLSQYQKIKKEKKIQQKNMKSRHALNCFIGSVNQKENKSHKKKEKTEV